MVQGMLDGRPMLRFMKVILMRKLYQSRITWVKVESKEDFNRRECFI